MKKIIMLAAALLAAASHGATMGSQPWVEARLNALRAEMNAQRAELTALMRTQTVYVVQKDVSMQYGVTNGAAVTTYSYGEGANRITLIVEEANVYALLATNATETAVDAGVTNGMYFVWDEPTHSYTNHAQMIYATRTNLIWNTVRSNGDSFPGLFDVLGAKLQPSVAREVTK